MNYQDSQIIKWLKWYCLLKVLEIIIGMLVILETDIYHKDKKQMDHLTKLTLMALMIIQWTSLKALTKPLINTEY